MLHVLNSLFFRWRSNHIFDVCLSLKAKIPTNDPCAKQTHNACNRLLEMSTKYQNGKRGLSSPSSLKWIGLSVTTSVVAVALVAMFRRPKLA